jgi:DNA-binding NtrC family response regulator
MTGGIPSSTYATAALLDVGRPAVLMVGLGATEDEPADFDLFATPSAREAIGLMRLRRVDLLVSGIDLPDLSVWDLLRRVRTAWPGQRVALVAPALPPDAEIRARTLGVMKILETPPDAAMLRRLLPPRQREPTTARPRTVHRCIPGIERHTTGVPPPE